MSDQQSAEQPMLIKNPLVIIFRTDAGVHCNIYHGPDETHEHYGLIICDLVRHVASAFGVHEDAVWEWVNKERYHPTTDITRPS